MLSCALLPYTPSAGFADVCLENADEIRQCLDRNIPVLVGGEIRERAWDLQGDGMVLVRLYPKGNLKRSLRFRIHADFGPGSRRSTWGLRAVVSIPLKRDKPVEILDITSTGRSDRIPFAEFNLQAGRLKDFLVRMTATSGPGAGTLDPHFAGPDRGREAGDLLVAGAIRCREQEIADRKAAANREAAFVARIRALADGTPLFIRTSRSAVFYQVGIKRRSVPASTALRARVPSPEELRDAQMLAAGMSFHQALALGLRAAAALEAAPGLAGFFHARKHRKKMMLSSDKPFHFSWIDPEERRARRAARPRIYVQGGFPYGTGQLEVNGQDRAYRWQSALPSETDTSKTPGQVVRNLRFSPRTRRQRYNPLRDFDEACGMRLVSPQVAEILQQHNIGEMCLPAIEILDASGEVLEVRHIIDTPSDIPLTCMSRLVPSLRRDLRHIAKLEADDIVVSGALAGDLDIWIDSQLTPAPLFLSARLAQALRKAGLQMPPSLKPCLVV